MTDGGQPVTRMNELEYVSGLIWANIWTTECIAIIVPGSGLLLWEPSLACALCSRHVC